MFLKILLIIIVYIIIITCFVIFYNSNKNSNCPICGNKLRKYGNYGICDKCHKLYLLNIFGNLIDGK